MVVHYLLWLLAVAAVILAFCVNTCRGSTKTAPELQLLRIPAMAAVLFENPFYVLSFQNCGVVR